jgi:hypothetical protein
MTTQPRQLRLHNLAALREDIKTNATSARELRQEARTKVGPERHSLKQEAKWHGGNTRLPLLALGYLRGMTIEQMESDHTRPDNLPSPEGILALCKTAWLKGPEADKATPETGGIPSWADFEAAVRADLKAWKARCLTSHVLRQAQAAAKPKREVA